MATTLILLGPDGGPDAATTRALDGALARLRAEGGAIVEGAGPRARWAVRGTAAEVAHADTTLTVRDLAPWMIEPGLAPATSVTVDTATGAASLARDRFGAKPLLYVACGSCWIVASEAALLAPFLPGITLDREALSDAVNFRWILGEQWLIGSIRQVVAGGTVTLAPGAAARVGAGTPVSFSPEPPAQSFAWWADRADAALRTALRAAGAAAEGGGELAVLVSGGIDSSVLAGQAKAEGLNARAYIVTYEGYANPEEDRARRVAAWLDLPVEDVRVTADQLRGAWVDHMVTRLEQPPRHVNNVALEQLLARAAARGATVVHGEGAEMMFGLADHARVRRFAKWRALTAPLRAGPLRPLAALAPGKAGRRLAWLKDVTVPAFARRLEEIPYSPAGRAALDALARGRAPCADLARLIPESRTPTHAELQAYQTRGFLQTSLRRLERLAAPLGVNVALPFLAAEVVALAARLPTAYKEEDGKGKPILRALCSRYLPAEVAAWPKMGFQTPDREWVLGAPAAARAAQGDGARLAAYFPPHGLAAAIAVEDHELRWLLLTLEATLRQAEAAWAAGR